MDYALKNERVVTKVEHFGIQRKIVAHMTHRSWNEIPHISALYEPDVTDFFETFQELQKRRVQQGKKKVTFNTLMLKVVAEGLKAAPALNAVLKFNSKWVTGTLQVREDIDISVPWTLPNGEMMTITVPDVQNDNLDTLCEKIEVINHKVTNTDTGEAMYEVSFSTTIQELKQGHLGVLRRVLAAKLGKHPVKLLSGTDKKKYYEIPAEERLTKRDLEQGTVTVSNIGSIHRGFKGCIAMLEIIPPQIFAMAIANVQERPGVYEDERGEKQIGIRKICPLCLCGDHRAIDYAEMVPFINRLDQIFANPEEIFTF